MLLQQTGSYSHIPAHPCAALLSNTQKLPFMMRFDFHIFVCRVLGCKSNLTAVASGCLMACVVSSFASCETNFERRGSNSDFGCSYLYMWYMFLEIKG